MSEDAVARTPARYCESTPREAHSSSAEAQLQISAQRLQEVIASVPEIIELLRCVRHLDCGAHYCRYCPAKSPAWEHAPSCPYLASMEDYDNARAMIGKLEALLIGGEGGAK